MKVVFVICFLSLTSPVLSQTMVCDDVCPRAPYSMREACVVRHPDLVLHNNTVPDSQPLTMRSFFQRIGVKIPNAPSVREVVDSVAGSVTARNEEYDQCWFMCDSIQPRRWKTWDEISSDLVGVTSSALSHLGGVADSTTSIALEKLTKATNAVVEYDVRPAAEWSAEAVSATAEVVRNAAIEATGATAVKIVDLKDTVKEARAAGQAKLEQHVEQVVTTVLEKSSSWMSWMAAKIDDAANALEQKAREHRSKLELQREGIEPNPGPPKALNPNQLEQEAERVDEQQLLANVAEGMGVAAALHAIDLDWDVANAEHEIDDNPSEITTEAGAFRVNRFVGHDRDSNVSDDVVVPDGPAQPVLPHLPPREPFVYYFICELGNMHHLVAEMDVPPDVRQSLQRGVIPQPVAVATLTWFASKVLRSTFVSYFTTIIVWICWLLGLSSVPIRVALFMFSSTFLMEEWLNHTLLTATFTVVHMLLAQSFPGLVFQALCLGMAVRQVVASGLEFDELFFGAVTAEGTTLSQRLVFENSPVEIWVVTFSEVDDLDFRLRDRLDQRNGFNRKTELLHQPHWRQATALVQRRQNNWISMLSNHPIIRRDLGLVDFTLMLSSGVATFADIKMSLRTNLLSYDRFRRQANHPEWLDHTDSTGVSEALSIVMLSKLFTKQHVLPSFLMPTEGLDTSLSATLSGNLTSRPNIRLIHFLYDFAMSANTDDRSKIVLWRVLGRCVLWIHSLTSPCTFLIFLILLMLEIKSRVSCTGTQETCLVLNLPMISTLLPPLSFDISLFPLLPVSWLE